MIKGCVGLFASWLTWAVFAFAGLLALDAFIPGAGMAFLAGVVTMVMMLADNAPAGVVLAIVLLLPAYHLGNRITVARIIADGKAKLAKDEERYTF